MSKLSAIKKQIAALEARARRIEKSEMGPAIAKVKAIMSEFNLTIEHLTQAVTSKGAVKQVKAKAASVAKYADPKTGKQWSGFGRAPGWIASAKNRETFLIDKSGIKAAEPVAKAPVGAKKATAKVAATASKQAAKSAAKKAVKMPVKQVAKQAAPEVQKPVPAAKRGAVSAKKAAPASNKVLRAAKKVAPAAKKVAPAAKKQAPVDVVTDSAAKKNPSAKKVAAKKAAPRETAPKSSVAAPAAAPVEAQATLSA